MKLKQIGSFRGKKRAQKDGFTSSRFANSQMTENARQAIEYTKKKDRSDYTLSEWNKDNLYRSDATKQLFQCAQNINRQHIKSLTVEEFVQKYEKKNLPVVIDGCTQNWEKEKYWTFQYFYREFKDIKFKIGEDDDGYKLRVPIKYYFQYLIYNKDDSPLYLFQSSLETNKNMEKIIQHYQVPPYFKDDLLKYAGESRRPPYRWLLMGPERSGSTVHIDPLSTSAWNTSLTGHKRWVLFPEQIPKSIVKGKAFRGKNYEDEAIYYFTDLIPKIIESEGRERLGIIQFVQRPGQTVFVPGGWWHAVINLDDTMAVTQNVMTHVNFDNVWRSIRSQRRKFGKKFLHNLKENEVQLYERAIHLNKQEKFKMGEKYEEQSVSLSFTQSKSSSSSSSSSESDDLSENFKSSANNKSVRSRSLSRSRQKLKRKKRACSQERTQNHL